MRESNPFLAFLTRPPRATPWTEGKPTCAGCGHTVSDHNIRERDRGCDLVGCGCTAYWVEDDR